MLYYHLSVLLKIECVLFHHVLSGFRFGMSSGRLEGAIQVSNQYPVCTFFSICTISPNLNGSGGPFLPQYLFWHVHRSGHQCKCFLGCVNDVLGSYMLPKIWKGTSEVGSQKLGETKNASMKIISPKTTGCCIYCIYSRIRKNCPEFELPWQHATWRGRGCQPEI